MWWIPCVEVYGLEVLCIGGGCVYMAGSIWIGIWEDTSANVRTSRCGWLRLVGWLGFQGCPERGGQPVWDGRQGWPAAR